MTARTFDAAGVHAIVVDHLARGSLTLEAGPRGDLIEGTVSAGEDLLQQTTIRQEGDTLRIWFPDQLFRTQTAHLRIGVPPGTALTARLGSADVTASVRNGVSFWSVGRGKATSQGSLPEPLFARGISDPSLLKDQEAFRGKK